MEDTRERMIRYLDDAWALEKALVQTLKDMAEETNNPEVIALLLEHRLVTHEQEERLEARIRAMGEEPSGAKGLLNQVISKLGVVMHSAHDEYDRTVLDLMKTYATENFECAVYQAMLSYAESIGDDLSANLAKQHLAEEQEAVKKIWPMIAPAASLSNKAAAVS